MRKIYYVIFSFIFLLSSVSCSENDNNVKTDMKLLFNDIEIPVIWEDNLSVKALSEELKNGDILVDMSMYGGNEQVGYLGKNIISDDKYIKTEAGDIVLYSGNNIVVFYGNHEWSYTRLGKIDMEDEEIRRILENGNINLRLYR